MGWKSYIPYHGDRSVRQKLRGLDEAGVGVPMFILLFFQKSIETFLASLGSFVPLPMWATYFIASLIVFVVWVYDKELKKKSEKVKQKGKEVKDKVEE